MSLTGWHVDTGHGNKKLMDEKTPFIYQEETRLASNTKLIIKEEQNHDEEGIRKV